VLSNEVITGAEADEPRSTRIVFAVASALVFVVFAGVTLYEEGPQRRTLRVIAPDEVGPGAVFPVVARAFTQEGVSLVTEIERGAVEVELLDGARVASHGALERSRGPFFHAELIAPERPGRFELVFRLGGTIARRELNVVRRPSPAALAPLPPELRPETSKKGGAPGLAAEVRVASGACVPEHPCEIFVVHEGDRGGVSLEAVSGLRIEPARERGEGVTSWEAVVQGLAARVEVEVTRGGERAALDVSLPVASGGVAVRGGRRLLASGDSIALEAASLNEGPYVHTHHHDGHLVAIGATVGRLTLDDLRPGVHRVQVGGDLFSPSSLERAGVFVFLVSAEGEAAGPLLERAASRELEALEVSDAFAARLLGEPGELAARAILARIEGYRAQPPSAITGEDRGFAERRDRVSSVRLMGAAIILLLGVWVVVASVRGGRRARRAARERARSEGIIEWVTPVRGAELRLAAVLFLGYLLAAAALLSRFWIFG
jgi:hypothetical protein